MRGHGDQTGYRRTLFGTGGGGIEAEQLQPRAFKGRAHMAGAVREAKRLAQRNAFALMGFDTESKKSARREHRGYGLRNRREIGQISKDIGGKDQIILFAGMLFGAQKFQQVADLK